MSEQEIYPEDQEWEDDLFVVINAKPETFPSQPVNAAEIDDEDSRIKALVRTPALQSQGYVGGGGTGGFGWNTSSVTPPPGYVCHRCNLPGHLIKYCPTNGDLAYDVKRIRPPTGIPKCMLVATADGSYALPTGGAAVLRPNEAAFDRAMEGISRPSSHSAAQLPPELYCRLCKQVMKDAVITSKCCFDSFCDRCIRGHIIGKCSCVCGATNVLADHLLPNVSLRNTISRMLESKSFSSNGEGASQVHDPPSTQQSAATKQVLPPPEKQEPVRVPKAEVETQGSASVADEEVDQKPEAPKQMKTGMPMMPMPMMPVASNNNMMAVAPNNSMMPVASINNNNMMPPMVGYNPYWGGMNGMNAYMPQYAGYGYGYGYGPYGYGYNYGYGPMNQPFVGEQGMKPSTVGFNAESREGNLKRKRDENQEYAKEVRGRGDMSSSKSRRLDRPSPSPQLPKKEPEHHHVDHSRHRDHRDDHYHREEPHHHDDHYHREERHHRDHSSWSSRHHRSESTKTMSAAESKRVPEEAASKNRQLSSSSSSKRVHEEAVLKNRKLSSSLSKDHYEHKASSVRSRKSTVPTRAPDSIRRLRCSYYETICSLVLGFLGKSGIKHIECSRCESLSSWINVQTFYRTPSEHCSDAIAQNCNTQQKWLFIVPNNQRNPVLP